MVNRDRCSTPSKAAALFGFKAEMKLEEGLKRTIDWWEHQSG